MPKYMLSTVKIGTGGGFIWMKRAPTEEKYARPKSTLSTVKIGIGVSLSVRNRLPLRKQMLLIGCCW